MTAFAIGCLLAFSVYLQVACYVLFRTPWRMAGRLALGVPVICMFLLALPGSEICPAVPLAEALRAIIPGLSRIDSMLFVILIAPLLFGGAVVLVVQASAQSAKR